MDRFVKRSPKPVVSDYEHHSSYPFPLPSRLPKKLEPPREPVTVDAPDLLKFSPFLDSSSARLLFDFLCDTMPWYRVEYVVRGIHIRTPRFTTVFGLDESHSWRDGAPYPSGKLKCKPRPIPGCLRELQTHVERYTAANYNFCLVNLYIDGQDSISYHSDDEHFLGPNPTIASLSLGASRDFSMRLKDNHNEQWKTTLRSGDMVVMRGDTQHLWEHSIPKRRSAAPRINITFRRGVVPYATDNYNRYNIGDGPFFRWRAGKMVQGDAKLSAEPIIPQVTHEPSFDLAEEVAAIEKAVTKREVEDVEEAVRKRQHRLTRTNE
ncbi:hypothetical protein PYCC9005_001749 [Savitreella phatthalungensis]